MIKLKQCPRCGGDLHTANDYDGPHIACLQCGYRGYPNLIPDLITTAKRRRKKLKPIQSLNQR